MKFKNLISWMKTFNKSRSKPWTKDHSVFQELTQKIQELELQNQKLSDNNKALRILLDSTSRKLSSSAMPPKNKDRNAV
jgi:hypothetical protein